MGQGASKKSGTEKNSGKSKTSSGTRQEGSSQASKSFTKETSPPDSSGEGPSHERSGQKYQTGPQTTG